MIASDAATTGAGQFIASLLAKSAPPAADAQQANAETPAEDDAVDVTLSDRAQRALAAGQAAVTTASGGDPTIWVYGSEDERQFNIDNYESNVAIYFTLAAVITDDSGTYTEDEQLAAYTEFMSPRDGGWRWPAAHPDQGAALRAVFHDSAMGTRARNLAGELNHAAMAAAVDGGPDAAQRIAQARLDAFGALSEFDQKIVFETSLSQTGISGRTFADAAAWTAELSAIAAGDAAPSDFSDKPYAKNEAEYFRLAAIVTDTSGAYAKEDQLAAYKRIHDMAIDGGRLGGGRLSSYLSSEINESAVPALARDVHNRLFQASQAHFASGDVVGGAKADLAAFDALSSWEQKVYFDTHINQKLWNSPKRYDDIAQYRDMRLAVIQAGAYMLAHTDRENGPPSAAAQRANPTLAALVKIANARLDAASYIAQIAELLGKADDPLKADDASAKDAAGPAKADARLTDARTALSALVAMQEETEDDPLLRALRQTG